MRRHSATGGPRHNFPASHRDPGSTDSSIMETSGMKRTRQVETMILSYSTDMGRENQAKAGSRVPHSIMQALSMLLFSVNTHIPLDK